MLAGAFGLALLLSPIFHPEGSSLYPGLAATGYLVADGVVCSALAHAVFNITCRYIPATEVSLLMQFDGIMGPLSTYLVLGEVPSAYTLGGGGFVVFVVVVHEAMALHEEMRVRPRMGLPGP
jgi:drug/metabolite transporter (DMT)-like permease